jgi:hypothetical protein
MKVMMLNWLICGTRNKFNKSIIFEKLNELLISKGKPNSIVEGCCLNSADVWAEEWAKEQNILIQHHPSSSGNYLRRNIEMIEKSDIIIAFWDGFSYGTAHTIAQAVLRNKIIIIYELHKSSTFTQKT